MNNGFSLKDRLCSQVHTTQQIEDQYFPFCFSFIIYIHQIYVCKYMCKGAGYVEKQRQREQVPIHWFITPFLKAPGLHCAWVTTRDRSWEHKPHLPHMLQEPIDQHSIPAAAWVGHWSQNLEPNIQSKHCDEENWHLKY